MNDITVRFLDTYEYLKKQNIVYTPKGFANEINVSTSLITEICKKRTNAGITPIQNLLNRFNEIDGNWLLTGKGSMLKSEAIPVAIVKKEDLGKIVILERDNERLKETNDLLRFKVSTLEKELTEFRYNSQKEPVLYKSVAESAPELIKKESK